MYAACRNFDEEPLKSSTSGSNCVYRIPSWLPHWQRFGLAYRAATVSFLDAVFKIPSLKVSEKKN
jgi:hypothetical protein